MKTVKFLLIFIAACFLMRGVNVFWASKMRLEWTREWMEKKNPTEYLFNHPMQEVKKVIETKLSCLREMSLHREKNSLISDMVKDEIGENDYILYRGLELESYVYRTGKQGRYYYFNLQIHLDSLSPDQTFVKIITHFREIVSGYRLAFAHMTIILPVRQVVEPSTIEEYQVLYKLGKALGEEMPAILYPASLDEEMQQRTYHNCFDDPFSKRSSDLMENNEQIIPEQP